VDAIFKKAINVSSKMRAISRRGIVVVDPSRMAQTPHAINEPMPI